MKIAYTWNGVAIPPEEEVLIHVEKDGDNFIFEVNAPFYDDPKPKGEASSLDGLWNYEVVEFFISGAVNPHGHTPYLEVELSPHGHYLVIELLGERHRFGIKTSLDFVVKRSKKRWHGIVTIPLSWLAPPPHRWNAYAIHGVGARRRYLAMNPTFSEQPDFHRLECFSALEL